MAVLRRAAPAGVPARCGVKRLARRVREEAIFVGLWLMLACAASGLGLLGDAVYQTAGGR